MYSRPILTLVVLVVVACTRPPSDDGSVVRTDSAGVRIVTSNAADRDLAWRFDTVGVLQDSLGEPWIFEGIAARRVVTDRAGRTYVLVDEPAIVRFGRDGKFERSIGRKGGAPGEMQFPLALIVQGDSLAVFDPVRGALVRFGPTLEPITDIPLRDGLADVSALAFRVGGVWVQRQTFDPEGTMLALFGDTSATSPLLSLRRPAAAPVLGCNGRIRISLPPFFSPEIHWGTSTGRLLANVGPGYELQLYEGPRLLASVRRNVPSRAPTEADVERLFPDGLRVNVDGRVNCVLGISELVQSPGIAPMMPFVHGLALLSDGTFWVQRSFHGESTSLLDVFASDGAYAGSVRGMALPVGRLPNGELLVPVDDSASGGQHIARLRATP